MITLRKFKKLNAEVQLHFLYGSGINLEIYRTVKNKEVVLYSLGDFYTEIYFNYDITRLLEVATYKSETNPAP